MAAKKKPSKKSLEGKSQQEVMSELLAPSKIRSKRSAKEPVRHVPSGVESVDKYLRGGLPKGSITEASGPPGSGKTSLGYCFMGSMCRMDPAESQVLFVDGERTYNVQYASQYGVIDERVLAVYPDYGEEAFAAMFEWAHKICLLRKGLNPAAPTKVEVIKNGKGVKIGEYATAWEPHPIWPDGWRGSAMIMVDSLASLIPWSARQRMLMGDESPPTVAELGRMMSDKARHLPGLVEEGDIAFYATNQLRAANIGKPGKQSDTPGGNAIPFFASNRWEMWRGKQIKFGEDVVGNWHGLRVSKSRHFAPYGDPLQIPFSMQGEDGGGINFAMAYVEALLALGVINKSGSWYSFDEQKGGAFAGQRYQGARAMYDAFTSQEDLAALAELIRAA